MGAERQGESSPVHGYPGQRDLGAHAGGKATVYLTQVGYNGPEVWRWGGIQNNGRERTDPRFEEFAMIGADGLTLDPQGRLIIADLCRPLAHARREERPAHRARRPLRGQALRRPQRRRRQARRCDLLHRRDTAPCAWAPRIRAGSSISSGVFMWKDGKVTLVVTDMPATNGLAFSPDEKYLYVTGGRRQLCQPLRGACRRHARQWPAVHRHEEGNRARDHRRPAGRHQGESLPDGSRTASGSSRRKASTSAPSACRRYPPM